MMFGGKMKCYIWVNPYGVSYGISMVFAVAGSLEEAKSIALSNKTVMEYSQYESGRHHPDDLGEPDRILDLPCAEWHEWAE